MFRFAFNINTFVFRLMMFAASSLRFIIPFIKNRYEFEKNNFQNLPKKVDLIFHLSSEGELEQATYLIKRLSKNQKIILVLYTSPSVKDKANRLQSENIIVSPLTFFYRPFDPIKIKAKEIFLVRYDFFPTLITIAQRKSVKSYLLSSRIKGKKLGFYLKNCLFSFDKVYAASAEDSKLLYDKLGIIADVVEFRVPQILKRINEKERFFIDSRREGLVEFWESFPKSKRIIFGSAWPVDLGILDQLEFKKEIKNGEWLLWMAPHQLNTQDLQLFKFKIEKNYGLPCKIVNNFENFTAEKGFVYICGLKGILVESYPYFGHAYIGGGFGRSVHSLLEPFMASCRIYCGHKVHRSSEYDIIMSEQSEQIKVFESIGQLKDFYRIIKESPSIELPRGFVDEQLEKAQKI